MLAMGCGPAEARANLDAARSERPAEGRAKVTFVDGHHIVGARTALVDLDHPRRPPPSSRRVANFCADGIDPGSFAGKCYLHAPGWRRARRMYVDRPPDSDKWVIGQPRSFVAPIIT